MTNNNPKVFISHASEDKERFVTKFATKLRKKAVDAWLDQWEIKPGDSLIDKIFEEGIKDCEVFVIILSEKSINKKWVKEELNLGTIQRIEKNTKIIPILIDKNIEVPTSLRHLVWQRIDDLDNYEDEFNKILKSIYDISEKPPLGEKPKYSIEINTIEGLTKTDSIVLKVIGDIVHNNDDTVRYVKNRDIFDTCSNYNLSHEDVIESLGILKSDFYIKMSQENAPIEMTHLLMTSYGFIEYCENFILDFEKKFKDIVSSILNEDSRSSDEIYKRVKCKLVVVVSILQRFNDMDYMKVLVQVGAPMKIFEIYPKGNRYLKNVLQG